MCLLDGATCSHAVVFNLTDDYILRVNSTKVHILHIYIFFYLPLVVYSTAIMQIFLPLLTVFRYPSLRFLWQPQFHGAEWDLICGANRFTNYTRKIDKVPITKENQQNSL